MLTECISDYGSEFDLNGQPLKVKVQLSFANPTEEEMELIKGLQKKCISQELVETGE